MLRTASSVRSDKPRVPEEVGPPASEEVRVREEESIPEELPDAENVIVCSDAEVYQQLVELADRIFAGAQVGKIPEERAIVQVLRACMDRLRKGEGLLTETIRQRGQLSNMAQCGTDSAILSLRLALELGADDKRCLAVGLCGLIHDIGMLRVPRDILEGEKLSAEEREVLRRHPIESQRMLADFGSAFSWLGPIVVQVHERRDGSGYPRGLSADEIHEIAQLVGLADTYLALARPRIDRPALVVYNALKEVIDMRRTRFDNRAVKALINIVSIFPLGSLVKLNNNTIGRVVGANKLYPTRPLVEILLNHRSHRLSDPQLVHLEEEPMLYIVDPAIDESVLEGK